MIFDKYTGAIKNFMELILQGAKKPNIMLLDRYLLRQFFPIFLVAVSMFVFLLLLIDLFSNLVRYLNFEVPVMTILKISFYFIPRSLSYALPISLLFAAAYTIGELYAKNELTTIFSSGIPFWRFSFSLLIVGFAASVFLFYLDDVVVIPTLKVKNELSRRALRQHHFGGHSDIVIKARNGRLIYSVDFFDNEKLVLNGVGIIETDESGKFVSYIRARSASWIDSYWEFRNASIYQFEGLLLKINPLHANTDYNEHPDTFNRNAVEVEELPAKEVGLLINDLRLSGLPYYQVQANYYHRYSFAATSFIVMFLSISMGGRFRKNILLMSLFTSLSVAVIYYITEMLCMTMAGLNIIHPIVGAWFPVVIFVFIGLVLLRSAKT
ncbi:MAG: LptF/LptG family permease [Treponema sp.]|nr:LptF/LptG family permease [Treponema sp.]MCL2271349.1 LptF/LptG family permease [Treponema sp.]